MRQGWGVAFSAHMWVICKIKEFLLAYMENKYFCSLLLTSAVACDAEASFTAYPSVSLKVATEYKYVCAGTRG